MPNDPPKTQQTQPKGRDKDGKPVEPITISVPKREDVEDALDRLIGASSHDEPSERA
jgi:hypothetical protein